MLFALTLAITSQLYDYGACINQFCFCFLSAMSSSASCCEALMSWITLINFLIKNSTRPTPSRPKLIFSQRLHSPSSSFLAWIQAASRKISLPATRVNSTFLLPQQRLSSQQAEGDSLWCCPLSRLTYIWYQCETRSNTISPKKTHAHSGYSPAKMASITPLEARSHTMSNTAPKRVDCLKQRAAIPSKASSSWLSPQQMSAARGLSRQRGKTAKRKAKRRQPMRLGTKRNTISIDLITKSQKQAVQQQNFYPTMNDLGPHFRALHFQSLAEENEDLRRRVAKLTEIEGYVELLVDKLEKAERREQMLTGENTLLRQQARELELKFSQNESMHGDEMRYVFAQHDQLLDEKNRALAHLKSQLEQEQARAVHADSDSKAQRNTLQRAIEEYQLALGQLRAANKELQGDLQLLYQSHEQERLKFASERDAWNAESGRLRSIIQEKGITVNQLGKQLDQLSSALAMADLQIKKMNDYNKQLQVSFQKRQAQTGETIMRLQQGMSILREEVQRVGGQCLSLRAAKSAVEQQLEQAKVVQMHLRTDNETYITDNQRLIFLLEEADKENAFLRDKHQELQEYSTAQNDQAKTENVRLREEIAVLNKNSSERETLLGTKQLELKQALNAKSSLQLQISQAHAQFQVISQELHHLQQAHIAEKARTTQLQLSLKGALQEGGKVKQALASAQALTRRIQQENSQLSSLNHQLSRQMSNPRQISKDYREQVDRMVKNFHDEREEQAKRHWLQKEKLREVYEYELKQKELEFARRTAELQQQILRGKRLEAITARATPSKLK